ncbi:MAG: hypothetical protein ACXWUP_02560 [Allosphingosinicella sp.]
MHSPDRLVPLLAVLLAGCAATQAEVPERTPAFRHLAVVDGRISTQNALRLTVVGDASLRATPATHREAVFGGHPFEVSMAALLGGDEAVMVHAERVADSSGRSNYDTLPAAGWPDSRFRLRSQCAALDRATVDEEHDLAFLDRHGWNPEGHLALEQYYVSTADHNQEVVISLIARVADCADETANRALLQRLRDRVRVMSD